MSAAPPSGARRRARAVVAVVTLVLSLAVSELILGRFAPQATWSRLDPLAPRQYRPSAVVPAELLPGARTHLVNPQGDFDTRVAINGQGLRMDREVTVAKPRGVVCRIAVVGDSFTFGYGVEAAESFPQLLEGRFAARGVEVLNLGFAFGFSPDCYYAAFRKAPPFEADVLVLALFVANDLTVLAETRWRELDEKGLPARVETDHSFVDDLGRHRQREPLAIYRLPVLRESHLVVGLARAFGRGPSSAGLTDRTLRAVYDPRLYSEPWPQAIEESFAAIVRCVAGFDGLARARGQKLLVAVIPAPTQVYEAVQGRAGLEVRLRATPPPAVPQRRLFVALDEAKVPWLDLLPDLVAAQDLDLYLRHDGHFTTRGHVVAATAIARELERRAMVPLR